MPDTVLSFLPVARAQSTLQPYRVAPTPVVTAYMNIFPLVPPDPGPIITACLPAALAQPGLENLEKPRQGGGNPEKHLLLETILKES